MTGIPVTTMRLRPIMASVSRPPFWVVSTLAFLLAGLAAVLTAVVVLACLAISLVRPPPSRDAGTPSPEVAPTDGRRSRRATPRPDPHCSVPGLSS
jgi:hypothetical protein